MQPPNSSHSLGLAFGFYSWQDNPEAVIQEASRRPASYAPDAAPDDDIELMAILTNPLCPTTGNSAVNAPVSSFPWAPPVTPAKPTTRDDASNHGDDL